MKKRFLPVILAIFMIAILNPPARAQKEGKELIDSLSGVLPKMADDTNKVWIFIQLSYELNDSDLEKAVEAGLQALKLAEKLKYDFGIACSKLTLGRNYFYQSKYPLAIDHGLAAERLFLKMKDNDRLCATYCLLCVVVTWFDHGTGLEYYMKAKSLVYHYKNAEWYARNISWILSSSKSYEPDSTLTIMMRYQDIMKKSKNMQSKASLLSSYSAYYTQKKQFDSALYFCLQADTLFERLNNKRRQAANYTAMGNIYRDRVKSPSMALSDKLKAEECFMRSTDLSAEFGSIMMTFQGYYQLYKIQKALGKISLALHSLEESDKLYVNWIKESNGGKIAYVAFRYENELNEKEMEILKLQNKRRMAVIVLGTTGTVLLVLLLVLFILVWRKRMSQKRREIDHQLTLLEQKALQSMMNPHFIFNALGSIQNYLLQKKSGEAALYLSQFARLIRQNLNAINSANINLEEEVDRLKNYLDLEMLRMENKFEYRIDIDEDLDAEDIQIPSMIIQPFVENSIWHGIFSLEGKGEIVINVERADEKSLKVIIRDNGIGMQKSQAITQQNKKHFHLGMEMTRRRLELLGKKYSINAVIEYGEVNPGSPNPGTMVVLVVPVSR